MGSKHTTRDRFRAEIEAVVPCKALVDLIEPYAPNSRLRELGHGGFRDERQRSGCHSSCWSSGWLSTSRV